MYCNFSAIVSLGSLRQNGLNSAGKKQVRIWQIKSVASISTGQRGLHMAVTNVLVFTEHSFVTHPTSTDTRTRERHKSAKSMRDERILRYPRRLSSSGTCLEHIWWKFTTVPVFKKKNPSLAWRWRQISNDCTSGEFRSCYQEHRPLTYEWIREVVTNFVNTRAMPQLLQQWRQ